MTDQNPTPVPANLDIHQLFDQMAEKIIEQQEAIIGPVAVDQAKLVSELKINWLQHQVDISGDPQKAIDDLVARFKELFGQMAVETCREAVSKLVTQLPSEQVPGSLK